MTETPVETAVEGRVRAPAPNRTLVGGNARPVERSLFAGGSILGAVSLSSCCVIPLVLFSLGVTGAWIGNLAALYPYKWIFFVVTAAFLGGGFWQLYSPRARACAKNGSCTVSLSDRVTRTVLWSATILAVAATAFPYVAPMFLDS